MLHHLVCRHLGVLEKHSAQTRAQLQQTVQHLGTQGLPERPKLRYQLLTQGLIVLCAYDVPYVCALKLLGRLHDRVEVCAERSGVSLATWGGTVGCSEQSVPAKFSYFSCSFLLFHSFKGGASAIVRLALRYRPMCTRLRMNCQLCWYAAKQSGSFMHKQDVLSLPVCLLF